MRCPPRVAIAGAIVLVSALWPGAVAHATLDGPCDASVNDRDVAPLSASDPGDAIDVEESDSIDIEVEASESIDEYEVELEYSGIRWTVASGDVDDDAWSRSVDVDDYARFGAGLYRVRAVSTGDATCAGAILINVEGQPLATPVGLVAGAFVLVGVVNGAASVVSGRRRAGR